MDKIQAKPKVILFDVYETLLDMSGLERKANNILGSKRGYLLWFELLMQYCFVDNCTDQFHDFNSIAKATLKMTAHHLKEKTTDSEIDSLLDLLKYLPVHEDVQPCLSAIHELGIRIAALTNIPEKTVRDRMDTTGLISYFEKVFSAERIGKYKPFRNVYLWAAEQLGVPPEQILFVTSHGWDIAGADNAGMITVYKMQSRHLLYSLSNEPDYQVKDLDQLVSMLT